MSNPSKSQNSAKDSSSRSAVCPPTARSPSLVTASVLTDPHHIPTALSNSVTTARGATPSEFEPVSGLSDTSAGSGRANSTNPSEVKTAKSPTSPEILMSDLRRGSLFGRQTKSQASSQAPQSITNITFSNNSSLSTASQMSSMKTACSADSSVKIGPPRSRNNSASRKSDLTATSQLGSISEGSVKSAKSTKSTKTAKSRLNKSALSSTLSNGASQSRKRKSATRQKKDVKIQETSAKTAKSFKKTEASGKSMKSSKKLEMPEKSAKAPKPLEKSMKSAKSAKSSKATPKPEFGTSGVVKKGDKQRDQSVYFPGVTNPQPPPARQNGKMTGRPYNWPGDGKCTRSMDVLAEPATGTPLDSSVYDVSNLPPAQRGLPSAGPPKSLFGTRKSAAPGAPKEKPMGNKILIIGQTPDGKTTVQMTIDMQVVAGVGLGNSGEPVDLKPKKVVVAGNEYALDSKRSG